MILKASTFCIRIHYFFSAKQVAGKVLVSMKTSLPSCLNFAAALELLK